MSATLSTIIRPAVTRRPGAFAGLFSARLDRIARYFVHRAAIATLHELDDRALWDIGLARSQIEAAVCGFMTVPDPGEDAMTASSVAICPAIGPRVDQGRRAATREAAPWT